MKEEKEGVNVFACIDNNLSRKIKMFQGKHGLNKNEAMAKILELYFEGKEEYELKTEVVENEF